MAGQPDGGSKKESEEKQPRVVKSDQNFRLDRETFRARLLERFNDPGFDRIPEHLEKVFEVAWDAYHEYRKSPRTLKAGPEFAEPEYQLPIEWLETRRKIKEAQARHDDPNSPARILVINGSARSDQTCPGEISKTYRLAKIASEAITAQKGYELDFLDLSRLTGEFGLVIYPCKACVSTAQPLCHWPCTCYPNHALRQTNDWMHEIYPLWIAAHGVMIVTPVNWYQAPSVLKLMIDRLVCADGGRAFSVVVHADAAGAENLRRILVDWMTDLEMIPAGPVAGIDRFLGYYEPYATSHDDLDKDVALQQEVRNTALELVETVRQIRTGQYQRPDAGLVEPRKK